MKYEFHDALKSAIYSGMPTHLVVELAMENAIAADQCIHELASRAAASWISVADAPYPTDEPFLAMTSDEESGQILVAEAAAGVHLPWETWQNYEDAENQEYAAKMLTTITHWMPLPKSPKETD